MLKIALVTPPISNLNTPYAAVPRLAAWLSAAGHQVTQIDLSLELALRLYSRDGLARAFAAVDPASVKGESEDVWLQRERYIGVIDEAIALLQGRDFSIAHRIVRGDHLPESSYFRLETPAARLKKFGKWGKNDLARHMATLMLLDLVDFFRSTLTPHVGLLEYGTSLASPQPSFSPLAAELERPPNVIVEMMLEAADATFAPDLDLVCFTCPFPGMMFGALSTGAWLSTHRPHARRALGGGFPSTELRNLTDPRVFDYVDYLVLDDGELPLQQICRRLEGTVDAPLHKTFVRDGKVVVFHEDSGLETPPFRSLPAPDYPRDDLQRYLHTIIPQATVVARLLNEGTWLKLTAAHGCYWKKCTFCDVHLPYIADFDPIPAGMLADQMDVMHARSGRSTFHFTDEAAPPALLVNLALELLRRGRSYQFWGNVRFDTSFTPDRCRLLAAAGMIAVTGGIEIASDALLPRIQKGITVPHIVKVLEAFSNAGISTHAYLIYGFPGETLQDSLDSLETLRQLVRGGLLSSGAYHEYALTVHSPIGKQPHLYDIRRKAPAFGGFAYYQHPYDTLRGERPSREVFETLMEAVKEYAEGRALDRDVREFFREGAVPPPTVPPDLVATLRQLPHPSSKTEGTRIVWLGGAPRWSRGLVTVAAADGTILSVPAQPSVADSLARCRPASWGERSAPRWSELGDAGWEAPFRGHGLVAV